MVIGKDSEEMKLLGKRLDNILERANTIYWIRSKKYNQERDILNVVRYNMVISNIDCTKINSIFDMTKPKELYDICIKSLDEIIQDAMNDRKREIILGRDTVCDRRIK